MENRRCEVIKVKPELGGETKMEKQIQEKGTAGFGKNKTLQDMQLRG